MILCSFNSCTPSPSRVPHALLLEIFTKDGVGTEITL